MSRCRSVSVSYQDTDAPFGAEVDTEGDVNLMADVLSVVQADKQNDTDFFNKFDDDFDDEDTA